MFALAPGRLSTITGCFSASESGCPMVLATISTAPPAAYGTTILIGRLGYGSPCAGNGASNAVPSKNTTRGSLTGTTHFTDIGFLPVTDQTAKPSSLRGVSHRTLRRSAVSGNSV